MPAPLNLTPLRLQLLREAREHGTALATVGERKGTGLMRAFRSLVAEGLLDPSGSLTIGGLLVVEI